MRHLVRFAYLALAHVWACIPVYASDIVIIGEFHDNPHHHLTQAKVIYETSPTSVVFEMLVPEQAENYNSSTDKSIDSIEALLQWEDFGWPAFELYEPIFSALGASHVYGAGLPRQDLGEAFQNGIVASFGQDADIFGLTQPLAPQEQKKEKLYRRARIAMLCQAICCQPWLTSSACVMRDLPKSLWKHSRQKALPWWLSLETDTHEKIGQSQFILQKRPLLFLSMSSGKPKRT